MKLKYLFIFITTLFLSLIYISIYKKKLLNKHIFIFYFCYLFILLCIFHLLLVEFIKTLSLIYCISFLLMSIPFLFCLLIGRLDSFFGWRTDKFEYLCNKIFIYFNLNPILIFKSLMTFPQVEKLALAQKAFVCFLVLRFFAVILWWKYFLGFFSLSQYLYLQNNCLSFAWVFLIFSLLLFFKNYKVYFFQESNKNLNICYTFDYLYFYCSFLEKWLKIALIFNIFNCVSTIVLDVNLVHWLSEYYINKSTFLDLYLDLISNYHKIINIFNTKINNLTSSLGFFVFFSSTKVGNRKFYIYTTKRNIFRYVANFGKAAKQAFISKVENGTSFKETAFNSYLDSSNCAKSCKLTECKNTVLHLGNGKTKVIPGCRQHASNFSLPKKKSINWSYVAYGTIGVAIIFSENDWYYFGYFV